MVIGNVRILQSLFRTLAVHEFRFRTGAFFDEVFCPDLLIFRQADFSEQLRFELQAVLECHSASLDHGPAENRVHGGREVSEVASHFAGAARALPP